MSSASLSPTQSTAPVASSAMVGAYAVLALVLTLPACVAYEPVPLDPDLIRSEFLARTPEDTGLIAFAAGLVAEGRTPAFDPSDGLGAAEAEVVALFFNPELRRLRAEAGISAAGMRTAGAFADPVFGLDAERILEGVDDPWLVGGTIGLSSPLSGRRDAERGAASSAHRAELGRLAAAEWEVRIAVRVAFARHAADEARVAAFAMQLAALEPAAKVVDIMQQAGEIPRNEARLYALDRAVRTAEADAAAAAAAESAREIHALLGLAPQAGLTIVSNLATTPAPAPATARSEAAARNPRLRARRAAYEATEEALRLEVARQFPDLSLSPGLASEDGMARALFSIVATPPLFNGNRRGIAEADARRAAEREAFAAETAAVIGGLEGVLARAAAAARIRSRLAETAVLADEQSADLRRTAEAGRFNPVAILESLNRVHEIRLKLVESRLNEAVALFQAAALIGPPETAASSASASRPATEESK